MKKPSERLHFVVQKHDASHLHYDFRLELNGVLKSWAVPKGPSLNPEVKRLAMMVEDHPLPYEKFEGIIPKGNYGAGTVMIWDKGIYFPLPNEGSFKSNLHKGSISFFLVGKKLQGEFSLVKITEKEDNSWLLVKKSDEFASKERILEQDLSLVSGRSLEQIGLEAEKSGQVWIANRENNEIDLTGGKIAPMPRGVSPMLATLAKEPFDREDWLFEIKWDGYRAIAEVEGEKVSLYSRKKQIFNQKFSPIVDELKNFSTQAIFDGEIVVLDEKGKPRFQFLQNYDSSKGHLIYYVFDLLYFNGHDLTNLTLVKRKSILQKILPKTERIKYSSHIEKRGKSLFTQAKLAGLEGIIAKNSFSVYHFGQRSQEWLKLKTQSRQEAIITGFTEGRGSRKHFGALVLGIYENNEIVYVGHAGGGFNDESLQQIRNKLLPLVTNVSPFRNPPKTNTPVTWVKPKLVAEIAFSEWTEDSHMRHPIFLGLREDKDPKQVNREIPKTKPIQKEPAFASEISLKERTRFLIEGKELTLTNLDKVYWPDEKYTKKDLINYYNRISDFILPYLKDRPESLLRFPNGIKEESFWQKNVDNQIPDWVQTIKIHSENEDRDINYLLCQNKATLIFLANLGCIDLNPWNSRIQSLEKPDYLIVDLDPEEIAFSEVVRTASTIHQILSQIKVPNFCKTSGATGLHVYIPLGAKYSYEQVKHFSEIVVRLTHQQLPKTTSLERSPSQRKGKVYLDYLQNRRGQTLASPYSVRPRPLATVSTPLSWEEVNEILNPNDFNIETIFPRLEKLGDIWSDFFKKSLDMEKALKEITIL